MQLSLRGMINKEKNKKMQEHPNSILQGTQGPLQGFSKSSDPLCKYFTNRACSDAPPPYRDPQLFPRGLWGIPTLKKIIRNAWSDLSSSPKLRW